MFDAERMSRITFSGIRKVFEEVHKRRLERENNEKKVGPNN